MVNQSCRNDDVSDNPLQAPARIPGILKSTPEKIRRFIQYVGVYPRYAWFQIGIKQSLLDGLQGIKKTPVFLKLKAPHDFAKGGFGELKKRHIKGYLDLGFAARIIP